MQKVSFIVDGQRIIGHIFLPKKIKIKNPAILFVNGWNSSQERYFQFAKLFAGIGYICLVYDMRGSDESEGDINILTTKSFLDDVYAAYDYLSNIQAVDKENISAFGSSFGCYLLLVASLKRKFKKLILRAPANYPNDAFNKPKMETSGQETLEILEWRKKNRQVDETFSLQAINQYRGEIFLIEGGKDESIPHETIANYINAIKDKAKLTYLVVEDVPHSLKDAKVREKYLKILVDWVTQ